MASFSIPVRAVESMSSSGGSAPKTWPAGPWKGTIETVESRTLPATKDGRPFAGYVNTGDDGKRLSIMIGDNEPLDGQDAVGAQKRFVDLVLEDGEYNFDNVDPMARGHDAWQLQRSQLLATNLALALGQVEEDGEGNVSIADGFLEALEAGAFNGLQVGFEIYHRKGKPKKNDDTGEMETPIYAEIDTFFPV